MTQILQAMIFAAGHAKRMRPLTDHLPKPLLEVSGRPLLSYIIDHLIAEGVVKIIINGYHAIDPLRDYINAIRFEHPTVEFVLSEEDDLLETGGGAVNAIDHIDLKNPLYMINGDAYWVNADHHKTTLSDLAHAWNDHKMDCLLLLEKETHSDYALNDKGQAVRSKDHQGDYMFTGIRIFNPQILKNYKKEKFSFLQIMDDCESKGRLYGVEHKGQWYHLSRPEDLIAVDKVA